MFWDFSCQDWEQRLLSGTSLMPALPLFQSEADIAVAFFDSLQLPDVPGTPYLRDAAGPWFREIVAAIFGSRDPVMNIRYVAELFGLVPKGSSKTSYGAAIMLVALLMNLRPRAEFLFIGPTQAIADLAFNQASGMVLLNEQLKARFHPVEHKKEIVDRTNGAKLKVKTFSLDILTGPKPAGVMLDELHLLGRVAIAARVLRQIRGGLEKISEGFFLITTTMPDVQPSGVFKEELAIARKIRDGKFQGRMLPILYEYPREIVADVIRRRDPANWHMVLPNLGRSLRLESLLADFKTEEEKGEQALQIWESQHLNVEIGLSRTADSWPGIEYWEAQADTSLTLEDFIARCDVIVAAADGGGLDDLLGLCILGREKGTGRWLVWNKAWAHVCVKVRRKEIVAQLEDFERLGELTFVELMKTAYDECADVIVQIEASGLLGPIGFDPVGASGIEKALKERGIEGDDRIVGISQGYRLSGAVKDTEAQLSDGTLIHAGQAIMSWCAGNAKIEQIKNGYLVTKAASGTAKIDPLMALFNCAALMRSNPEPAANAMKNAGLFELTRTEAQETSQESRRPDRPDRRAQQPGPEMPQREYAQGSIEASQR